MLMIFLFSTPLFFIFLSSCRLQSRAVSFLRFHATRLSTPLRHHVTDFAVITYYFLSRGADLFLGNSESSAFPLAYLSSRSYVSLFAHSFSRYSFFLPALGAPFAPGGALYANPNGHDDQKPRVIVSRSPRLAAYVDDLHVLRPPSLLLPARPLGPRVSPDRIGREGEERENDVALSRRTC